VATHLQQLQLRPPDEPDGTCDPRAAAPSSGSARDLARQLVRAGARTPQTCYDQLRLAAERRAWLKGGHGGDHARLVQFVVTLPSHPHENRSPDGAVKGFNSTCGTGAIMDADWRINAMQP
jgi:hypothetical protein